MGSTSDMPIMEKAAQLLNEFEIPFEINALSTASGTSDYITVYRTSLVKTDKWRAPVSYKGVAQTVKLSDLGVSADSQSLKYSINMASWRLPFNQ